MSQPYYTGNPTPNIYPQQNPGSNLCWRFTNKSVNGCEQLLYENYWIEQINLYGQQVNYYVHNYNTLSADNFYGEQPTQQYSAPQPLIMAINLNENALLLSKYGLLSDDEITAFVPYSSFYAQFGAGSEPKAEDVFALSEYGSDRPDGRGPNYYVITQRLDQDIAQINPLMGHYVWLIKAKRFEYSFEPGLSGEQVNQQVYDDTLTPGVTGADRNYTTNVDQETIDKTFDYTESSNYDSVYGGYIPADLSSNIPTNMTPNNSLNLGAPTGIYATWYTYTDVAGAQFRNLPTGWVQIQPAVVNSAPAPGPNGIIPTNYLITIPGQQLSLIHI